MFFIFFTAIFAEISLASDLGSSVDLFKVKKIKFEGNKKVESEAIFDRIRIRKGSMITNYDLRDDIKKIYEMNYFEWVEAHREKGNTLVFKLKEKPIISNLSFEGNDEINDEDLTAVIKTKEFSILDVNLIKSDLKALLKHYEDKGFYLANIKYELTIMPNGNVNLVYKIHEFEKVKVKKIIFLGNKTIGDHQLKDIMETREESLMSSLSGSGNFKEFSFQTDLERIKYFYKSKGHLQVNLGAPDVTVSEDKRWVFITIKVNEGPQFKINEISFQGEALFTDDVIRSKISLKEGDLYSEEQLRLDIKKLTEIYQDEGYAFANVLRTLNIIPGENKINLEFSFEKGKLAHFGRINILGNYKTRDKVIRRELTIKEGGRFSGSELRRSRENVVRLGFFEPQSVIFNTVSRVGQDDVIDIDISIKERNTGQISLGAGYSTATGAFMQASIAQNNFLGRGQNLTLSLSLSSTNKTYNLGFTEPYLYDSKWTAGGDIYSQNNTASSSLSYKRQGFDLRLGYPIFDYTRIFGTYKFEDTQINSVNDPTIDEDLENGVASIIRFSLVRDLRNNKFEPSSGYYTSVSSEYAGLAGDKKWFKVEADARYFHRVVGDLIFRSRLYASKISRIDGLDIPRTERLTLGGARNLRGYSYEAIGPKQLVEEDGVLVSYNSGGLFAAFTSLELEHPLAREAGLKWVVFFDAGDAGLQEDFSANLDYGFGFRWFSPIGVLRFEFGYPLNPEDPSSGSQFHFDIGQLF